MLILSQNALLWNFGQTVRWQRHILTYMNTPCTPVHEHLHGTAWGDGCMHQINDSSNAHGVLIHIPAESTHVNTHRDRRSHFCIFEDSSQIMVTKVLKGWPLHCAEWKNQSHFRLQCLPHTWQPPSCTSYFFGTDESLKPLAPSAAVESSWRSHLPSRLTNEQGQNKLQKVDWEEWPGLQPLSRSPSEK